MRRLGLLAVLLALTAGPAAAGPFDELMKTVPPSANTLVLVDVAGLTGSAVGKKAGWAVKVGERYRDGSGVLPPGAERVLIAGQVDLQAGDWEWKAAVADTASAPALADVAARERGEPDEVAGLAVVHSPRGAYFAAPAPNRWLVFHPDDRPALAEWVRRGKEEKSAAASRYLTEAARRIENLHVVVAADLSDAIAPASARAVASAMPSLVRRNADPAAFARLLVSLRGVTLTAHATDRVQAVLRFDFGTNPLPMQAVLKDALLELVENHGAALPELAHWESAITDNTFRLSGTLTPESLERVLGLFAFPYTRGPAPKDMAPTAEATKWYLDTVRKVVQDVRKTRTGTKPEKTALWHDAAAGRIEHLDPRGVDPAALETGQAIAYRLRAVAGSMRGVPVDLKQLQSQAYFYGGRSGWGLFGGPNIVFTNVPKVQAQMNQVIAEDKANRELLGRQIDDLLSQTRSKLATKYPGL
jgi:hypothetical protein